MKFQRLLFGKQNYFTKYLENRIILFVFLYFCSTLYYYSVISNDIDLKNQMALLRVRSKFLLQTCNQQKDLQQTSHSFKLQLPSANTSNMTIANGTQINCWESITQLQTKSMQWNYSSPMEMKNGTDEKVTDSADTAVHYQYQQSTPESKNSSYYREFRRKFISKLTEVSTVESKFMITATPNQVLQESQIVFKGSRDVEKIVPVKLVYEQYEKMQSQLIPESSTKNYTTESINLKIVRQSNNTTSLVILQALNLALSLVKIEAAYCLEYLADNTIVQTYRKHKIMGVSYLICEPYEYTLDQLLTHGKINRDNIMIVYQHLMVAVKTLCQEKSSFFEINRMQKTIFYVHGKFKFLPIFAKAKIQTLKSFEMVSQQVLTYLLNLL